MALQDGSDSGAQQNYSGDRTPSLPNFRKELHWLEIIYFVGQTALVIVGIVAVIVYGSQLGEMKYTNKLTKSALDGSDLTLSRTLNKMQGQIDAINTGNALSKYALMQTQRAFLYVAKFNISAIGDVYKINFVWSNGGTTPTRFMREATHARLFKGEMPERFILHNSAERGTQMFVGPKSDSWGEAETFPAGDLAAVATHHGHLYIWGWATYFDVFQKTGTHITQFCTEVTDVTYLPGGTNIVTTACKRGNCTDDECKAE